MLLLLTTLPLVASPDLSPDNHYRPGNDRAFLMITTTCILAWLAVLLLLPITILLWAAESKPQTIKRLSRYGYSQRTIAQRLGISRYQVRKVLAMP